MCVESLGAKTTSDQSYSARSAEAFIRSPRHRRALIMAMQARAASQQQLPAWCQERQPGMPPDQLEWSVKIALFTIFIFVSL